VRLRGGSEGLKSATKNTLDVNRQQSWHKADISFIGAEFSRHAFLIAIASYYVPGRSLRHLPRYTTNLQGNMDEST